MDAFTHFKGALVDAVKRLDFLAECRRLTTDAEGAAGAAGATPPGPALDPRTLDGLARLVLDLTTALSTHGAAGAGPVVLARRLCDDVVAAAAAVRDEANGDEWRRLRPGIVERLGELERAVMTAIPEAAAAARRAELDARRRELDALKTIDPAMHGLLGTILRLDEAKEALRVSRSPTPLSAAPPPGPASASPSPATPAPVSPSPVSPAPPPKPKPMTPGVEAVEPSPVPPAVARDSKPASTDDERLAGIVRRLSDNACRVTSYLRAEGATSYRYARNRKTIAKALPLSVDDVNAVRKELAAAGVPIESKGGLNGGWWLTPDGVRVAEIASREPPPATAAKAGNGTKPGVIRG